MADQKSQWLVQRTTHIRKPSVYGWHESVVCFNLEGTLIKTKSGNKTPKDAADWELIHEKTVEVLKRLQNVSFAIISHERELGLGKISLDVFKRRIDSFCTYMATQNIHFYVLCSTLDNCLCKPHTRLWHVLCSIYKRHRSSPPSEIRSIYVGHLGGHLSSSATSVWGVQKKDSSSIDRAFANNIGCQYHHPDVFFNKEKYDLRADPSTFKRQPRLAITATTQQIGESEGLGSTITGRVEVKSEQKIPKRQWAYKNTLHGDELKDMVSEYPTSNVFLQEIQQIMNNLAPSKIMTIMIGPPCSGKTSYADLMHKALQIRYKSMQKPLNKCFIVQTSTHKSALKEIKQHIEGQADIIVDACNASSAGRADIISLCKDFNYAVIMLYMDIDKRLSVHLSHVRVELDKTYELTPVTEKSIVAYNKKFNEPSTSEGEQFDVPVVILNIRPLFDLQNAAFWYIYE